MNNNNQLNKEEQAEFEELIACSSEGFGAFSAEEIALFFYKEGLKKGKESKIPRFPAMLRKMWTGQEVQDWLDSVGMGK